MQFTLLDMTQNILSSMSSDEVNSISDTTESMQVAQILKNKYFDIVSRGELPEHNELFQLQPSLSPDNPVLMFIPDGVSKLEWLKYFNSNVNDGAVNTSTHGVNTDIVPFTPWATTSITTNTIGLGSMLFTVVSAANAVVGQQIKISASVTQYMYASITTIVGNVITVDILNFFGSGTFSSWDIIQIQDFQAPPGYQYVTVLPIRQFIDMVNGFNPNDNDVEQFTFTDSYNGLDNNFTFYFKNSHQPRFCTVLSNYYVIFDAYDNTQDSTIQASKTMAWGQIVPFWTMEDTFIPDLDDQQFPLLINEAKSLAFFELKQQQHVKADQEIKRQWSTVQRNKSISNKPTYFDQLPNFGRSGGWFGPRGMDNQWMKER